MRNALLAAIVAVTGFSSAALAEGKVIGVSWAQFQEERWKIDEAAMKAAIEAAGDGACGRVCEGQMPSDCGACGHWYQSSGGGPSGRSMAGAKRMPA